MKMKLFSSQTSPFARKVRVAVQELELDGLVDEIHTDVYNATADFLTINPLAQIPALVTEKGETLPGSDLIIEYLQSRANSLTSLPRGSARWGMLRRRNLAEGILEAAVSMLLESRRPDGEKSPAWMARKTEAIQRSLDVLEADVDQLLTEKPSVVEIGIGCALGYLDFRFATLDWRRNRPALTAWYAAFAERPSMLKTVPQ